MFQRLKFRAMGSDMLVVVDQDLESAPEALTQVPGWFEEWEQTLSRFRADSELSRLNHTFDQPVPVSRILWDVFETSQWAERYSNGLVTPTIFDAILDAGYDRNFDDLPRYQNHSMSIAPVIPPPLSIVVADEVERTLCLPEGLHLDFGGVAKGWAAHQAMGQLREQGPVLVNAGGDIAISGPHADGSEWQIGVNNPFERGKDFEFLYVKGGGVATSSTDHRRWMQDGRLRHHIINPLTGQPVETNLLSATIIAPTVMEAEAAAKTVMIMGADDGMAWIESNPHLAGLLMVENGHALYSRKMQEYL
ncbi:MAG: FAD:protein FMN transferase [Anaerolineales bacterium]|nr:FAD:protein FMN transferase [Anaerolineales bacterium]